jgi:chaperonin GroES
MFYQNGVNMSVAILGDRVLIKKLNTENKSAGGLVMMSVADIQTPKGTVLKVGEGKTTKTGTVIPLTVKVGDTVMYYPQAGIKVVIDGEELLVLREDDIYAVTE